MRLDLSLMVNNSIASGQGLVISLLFRIPVDETSWKLQTIPLL